MQPIDGNRVALEAWADFDEHLIASGSRAQSGSMLFKDGEYLFGVWAAEPNVTSWLQYPCHEWMLVLEGEITIVDATQTLTYRAGDSFVIPMHAKVVWAQPKRVRKFFVATTEGTVTSGVRNGSAKVGREPWTAGPLMAASHRSFSKGDAFPAHHHTVVHEPSTGNTFFIAAGTPGTFDRNYNDVIVCSAAIGGKASL